MNMNCQQLCGKDSKVWMVLPAGQRPRPKLFNWISIALLTTWVVVVAVVVETGEQHSGEDRENLPQETFMDGLIR